MAARSAADTLFQLVLIGSLLVWTLAAVTDDDNALSLEGRLQQLTNNYVSEAHSPFRGKNLKQKHFPYFIDY